MTPADSADPIAVLLGGDTRTRDHLQTLASCTHHASGAATNPELQEAIAWLDGPAQTQRHILEDQIFPTLLESMAGSDAVCLRDLTANLTHDRNALDWRWHTTIRPSLRATDTLASTDLQRWIGDFNVYLQRIDDELLPMVPRLFDDDALEALARACEDSQCPGIDPRQSLRSDSGSTLF